MERFYAKLYQFNFNHTFYTDSGTRDFLIYPISGTSKIARSNGMIIKPELTGFDLIYQKKSDVSNDPYETIDENFVLTFGIGLQHKEVLNVTDLPVKNDSTDIYICSELYAESELSLGVIATRQPNFTESYTYTSSKVTLKIEDNQGDTVYEQDQTGFEDPDDSSKFNFSFSVNLSIGINQGRYKLKTFIDEILQDELDVYIFNRFDFPELIGVFELEIDNNIDYTKLVYEAIMGFTASTTVWTYKIKLIRDFSGGSITIENTDVGDPLTFSETSVLVDYSPGETVVFKSDSSITKTEAPLTNFKLVVDSTSIDFTIDKLPNPTHNNTNSIVYLKI